MLEAEIHRQLKDHQGYRAIQAIDRVGRVFGAIFVAEIGVRHRPNRPSGALACPAEDLEGAEMARHRSLPVTVRAMSTALMCNRCAPARR